MCLSLMFVSLQHFYILYRYIGYITISGLNSDDIVMLGQNYRFYWHFRFQCRFYGHFRTSILIISMFKDQISVYRYFLIDILIVSTFPK